MYKFETDEIGKPNKNVYLKQRNTITYHFIKIIFVCPSYKVNVLYVANVQFLVSFV